MNMIRSAKNQIAELTAAAYRAAVQEGLLPEGVQTVPAVEIPKDTANGDYTTTFCLAASKAMRKNPREVAKILTEHMDLSDTYFTSVEIAGPGFLNFRLGDKWYADVLTAVEEERGDYGRDNWLDGKKYMVEFVSANPTGPMHMGTARGGVLGDTLAEVLDWSGADVWREFYVNDFGNQIEKFAKSIEARYIQLIKGEDAIEFPEDGYHGDDIRELAKAFYDLHGESYLDKSVEERHADMARFGLDRNIPKMKSDLERYGIKFDEWFFESSLHNSGYVKDTVEELHKLGWTYEKEGALWLKTADIMREQYRKQGKKDEDIDKLGLKDDVLRRANGFYTYFAADIAYHRNKFEKRGFDKVINVWGADHHGHVARLKGAIDALGLDGTNRLDIVLMQLVKLVRDGEVVRMSKRTGKTISLSDLLDEIPVDACRYFFNAKPDTQMEFDLGLAVREDSENPIYYIQYAHARICSLLKALEEEGHSVKPGAVDLSILSSDAEHALIKELSSFAEEIRMAARDYDPSYINRYLMRLAAAFHKFYNACRIKGEDEAVIDARLKLASATRQVLANGLKDENLRLRDHDPEELCFYSKATTDFEFLFPFGWGELWGVADRTDYDLTQHQTVSGEKMVYREGEGKDMVEYIPYVIEPSLGVERSVLAGLCDAYDEEVVGQDKKGNDDVRVVLHFHPALAPFKAAILPLSKKEVLTGPAQELYAELSKEFMVDYDETGSIGKRYRREDEIGTPFCITFDFETVGDENTPADHCVTVRERDTMQQVRMPISEVKAYLREKCAF